jgi:hypothetical protein
MKSILSISTLFFVFSLNAQTFQLNPGNEVTTNAPVNEFVVGEISMLNTSDEPIVLRWALVEKTTPSVWDYSYCDFNLCYTGDQTGGTMAAVQPGSQGFIKVNAYTTAASSSHFVFSVWDENFPNEPEIIEFWFNGVASIENQASLNKLVVYPNPAHASSLVTIDHIPVNSKLRITNSLGQLVYSQEKLQGKTTIDQELPKGVYIVTLTSNASSESRKLIIR